MVEGKKIAPQSAFFKLLAPTPGKKGLIDLIKSGKLRSSMNPRLQERLI